MKKPKPLRERLTKTLLAQLYSRGITVKDAAEKLGVSIFYLSRTVAAIQGKVPGVTAEKRAAAKKLNKMREQVRRTLAKRVKSGRLTVAQAALEAGCSERTISRYVAQY